MSGPEEPFPEAALLAETAWLRRLARHMVGEEDADDVVQGACVKALERPPKDPSRLRGWLAQVVRNTARGRLRDRLRRLRREAAAARDEAAPSGDDVVIRAETQQRVVGAVLALDEPYRTTVLLRFFDDLPPRKVAARMGVPVATVHTRLRRGLDRLRARLGDRNRSWALVLLPLLAREGKLGSLLAFGGAVMSKKAVFFVAAAALALSVGGVIWLSRAPRPERAREPALARGRGGEEVPEPGGGLTVSAEGRVRLRGRVVDADGNPVPGARVDIMAGAPARTEVGTSISRMGPGIPPDAMKAAEQIRADSERAHASRGGTACDAEGRFDLAADAVPGDYLLARAPGFAAAEEAGLSFLRPAMGIEIRLKRQIACRVRVVDEKKAPVAGAQVTLLSRGVLARAETDALGLVDFAAEPRGDGVVVECQGYSPAHGYLRDAQKEEITVELRPAAWIEGTVLRASDRAPVARAAVYIDFGNRLATTGADGRFSLERTGLQSSPYKTIVVDAGPMGVASVAVRDVPPSPLEILLHPTLTLEGKLVGSGPLEGRRVLALQPGLPWRAARAEASGVFRIEGTAADVPVCVVFDPWDPLYEEKGAAPAEAKYEPWPGFRTIEIVGKAAIEGRVVDEAGRPVAGARIEMRPRFADGIGATPMSAGDEYTDEDGRFRIDQVSTRPPPSRPGVTYLPAVLRVSASGFVWRNEELPSLEPGEERAGLVIRLERGLSITGRVVMEDGSKVPPVKVHAYERGVASDDLRHSGSAQVDGDGHYRIGALPAGTYTVGVWADDFQPAWLQDVPAGGEAPPLILRRGATIEGIVVDDTGSPLPGIAVSAWSPRINRGGRERTDADGRFRIRQLEPGTYDVQAAQHGYLWESRPGIAAPSGDVRFVLRRGLSIKGRIVRADGTALDSVRIHAERTGGDLTRPGSIGDAGTATDGRFEITGLSEGEFRLTFEARDEASVLGPMAGVVSGTEILVRAEAAGLIEGRVVDRDGKPVAREVAAVPLDPDGYAQDVAWSREDGTFRIGSLKGSRFTLVAGFDQEYGFALDVRAGATDVTIVMGRGEVLAGTVVDKDGNPASANVTVFHGELAQPWQLFTKDGRFRFEGLPPGAYFLNATPPNQTIGYERWRDTKHRGPPGTRVEAGTQDVTLTMK